MKIPLDLESSHLSKKARNVQKFISCYLLYLVREFKTEHAELKVLHSIDFLDIKLSGKTVCIKVVSINH